MEDKDTSYDDWMANQEIGGRTEDKKIKLQKELEKSGITLEAGAINYERNLAIYELCLKKMSEGISTDVIIQDLQFALKSQGIK
jgi:hypothetical protein